MLRKRLYRINQKTEKTRRKEKSRPISGNWIIRAMIYINDKVNISANARRTFIEVTDDDSLEFLNLLAEFVNTIYDTRYALSNYASAKDKQDQSIEKLQKLRIYALNCLRKLAKEEIKLTVDDEYSKFDDLSVIDKKRYLRKKSVKN